MEVLNLAHHIRFTGPSPCNLCFERLRVDVLTISVGSVLERLAMSGRICEHLLLSSPQLSPSFLDGVLFGPCPKALAHRRNWDESGRGIGTERPATGRMHGYPATHLLG